MVENEDYTLLYGAIKFYFSEFDVYQHVIIWVSDEGDSCDAFGNFTMFCLRRAECPDTDYIGTINEAVEQIKEDIRRENEEGEINTICDVSMLRSFDTFRVNDSPIIVGDKVNLTKDIDNI